MLKGTILSLFITSLLCFPSALATTVDELLNRRGFVVPDDPFQYYETPKEQQNAWKQIERLCIPLTPYEVWDDESCHAALHRYFLDEPVWAYSSLYYYDRGEGLLPLPILEVNSRPKILPYSYADFLIDEIPFWRDILDDKVEERADRSLEVIQDFECKSLINKEYTGVRKEMGKKCSARELYKYATYLDGCIVGLQRLQLLMNPPMLSGILANENTSAFEAVLAIIDDKFNDGLQRKIAKQRLTKGYLHSIWMTKKCTEFGYRTLPNIEISDDLKAPTLIWGSDDLRLYQQVNGTHDIILKISAKSGDPWAIQSYPLGIVTSSEFNADIKKLYPLLTHRHMGSLTGWFRSEFTVEESAQHRAKAYLILKDSFGTKIARRVYDPNKLKTQINFILDGGSLKEPRPLSVILKERSSREDNQEQDNF